MLFLNTSGIEHKQAKRQRYDWSDFACGHMG